MGYCGCGCEGEECCLGRSDDGPQHEPARGERITYTILGLLYGGMYLFMLLMVLYAFLVKCAPA